MGSLLIGHRNPRKPGTHSSTVDQPGFDEDEEILLVVDEHDDPVAEAPRSHVHAEGLRHRAVHVLLGDGQGRIWLQKRSEHKRTHPHRWTSSASGHVPTGQTLREAARRELSEELGIPAPPLAYLGWVYVEDLAIGEREFHHAFAGVHEGEVDPDEHEVSAAACFDPHELEERLGVAPDAFAPSFREVWRAARAGRLETDTHRLEL